MNTTDIPQAIQDFVEATNAADSEAFLAAFTADAYLNDWGREFRGREGLASWNRTDNIGVRAHFEIVSLAPGADGTLILTVAVTGDGFNGTGTMTITLAGEKISRLVIS
jgi:ketosteroid isomerase-like protein